jgi:uncharacterized protein YcbK (DUF882 family)
MISKYITEAQATKSDTAKRLGLSNEPTPQHLKAMQAVGEHIFDKVKEHEASAYVSSMYRSKEVNDAVAGSSKTSQHLIGEAIDIDSPEANVQIFNFVKDCLVFDQLIGEYPDAKGNFSWVHVSYVEHPKKNRHQILIKLKDKYIPFGEYKIGQI